MSKTKYITIPVIMIIISLLLTSCSGADRASREVEDLRLITTVGIDRDSGGIQLTVATQGGVGDGSGGVFTARGQSLAQAIETLRRGFTKGEAFFAHTEHFLIGSGAYDTLPAVIDFITRSTDMRLGVNLFIASNAPAAQMIQSCQSGESGICDMLTAMAREAESCGKGKTFTCGDVLERLANGSCALAQAVCLKPPEEQGQDAPQGALDSAGFAVIKDSAVEGFTSDDETAGVLLLGGWLRDTVELGGVTVELTDVKTDIDTENMMDIDINVEAKGTVVENSAGVRLSDTSGREVLERKMALTLLTQVKSAVTRGADMDADICGIARGIRLRHPVLTRDAEMNSVPSGASYNINIKATLVGTYDAEDAVLPVQGETEAAGEG